MCRPYTKKGRHRLEETEVIIGKTKLADGKTIGGKGRLTKKEIDKLQVYYGLAIRRNVGNVQMMKESIDAILRHRVSTSRIHNHTKCPTGKDSWCGFQRGGSVPYNHNNPLAKAVAIKIKPLFDRLSEKSLLERCADGHTQNAAESFNNVLWHLCPKVTFAGATQINLCAFLAVLLYNDGHMRLNDIFSFLGIDTGIHTKHFLQKKDNYRVYQSQKKHQ